MPADNIIDLDERRNEPTIEGRRRYPVHNGYHPVFAPAGQMPDLKLPCTCRASCHRRCGGECGCKACGFDLGLFCDEMGWSAEGGILVSKAEALSEYRSFG